MIRPVVLGITLAGLVLLGGCKAVSDAIPSSKVDYKAAGKLPPLEVPPDLTRPGADDRFAVPDVTTSGTATYSVYNRERTTGAKAGTTDILPAQNTVRIERSGSQRWLVATGTPEQLWSTVKDFWQEAGFIINLEVPEAGVMETDWTENRARIPDGGVRGFFGKVIDSVSSTAERDKFRTRLERGSEPNTTEIFVSHRGMMEIYTSEGRDSTKWQPRPADPELEAEMLQRLMTRFGVQEAKAKSELTAPAEAPRAHLSKAPNGSPSLAINDEFDRAWRRVGLALDRVGFTVEDRDRSKGVYFVRYVDPEADNNSKQPTGFFSKLAFWRSDKKNTNEQYRIEVKEATGGAEVNVLDKDGKADTSSTSNRILTLLYEQLK
ncbi:MAG TPA: outer membrane protein assembly factor BamC [Burkholderiales bacterium]|nr:outer membrane protein assembly factor BamC [Burkholderiales bacterium]